MDIEKMTRIQHADEHRQQVWEEVLTEQRAAGIRLISVQALGLCLDESSGEWSTAGVRVIDFNTGSTITEFSLEEFQELDYRREGWFGADHYYL